MAFVQPAAQIDLLTADRTERSVAKPVRLRIVRPAARRATSATHLAPLEEPVEPPPLDFDWLAEPLDGVDPVPFESLDLLSPPPLDVDDVESEAARFLYESLR